VWEDDSERKEECEKMRKGDGERVRG